MPARLVALDDGPDIPLDRTMVVVGRHPQCDARLDSLRVSRHHCCMTRDKEEILVRDLGSTNGIRINGQRLEVGRLKPGDELMIAHYRYRLEDSNGQEMTLVDSNGRAFGAALGSSPESPLRLAPEPTPPVSPDAEEMPRPPTEPAPAAPFFEESKLVAKVRELLPAGMAEHCRIQVILQMPGDQGFPNSPAEERVPCQPDSSL
ncbi:FHA domain-containing protein [Isosphaeraceae bacterium EP7]